MFVSQPVAAAPSQSPYPPSHAMTAQAPATHWAVAWDKAQGAHAVTVQPNAGSSNETHVAPQSFSPPPQPPPPTLLTEPATPPVLGGVGTPPMPPAPATPPTPPAPTPPAVELLEVEEVGGVFEGNSNDPKSYVQAPNKPPPITAQLAKKPPKRRHST